MRRSSPSKASTKIGCSSTCLASAARMASRWVSMSGHVDLGCARHNRRVRRFGNVGGLALLDHRLEVGNDCPANLRRGRVLPKAQLAPERLDDALVLLRGRGNGQRAHVLALNAEAVFPRPARPLRPRAAWLPGAGFARPRFPWRRAACRADSDTPGTPPRWPGPAAPPSAAPPRLPLPAPPPAPEPARARAGL